MRISWFLIFIAPAAAWADADLSFSDGSTILVRDSRVLFGEADNAVLFEPGRDGLVVLNHRERTFLVLKPGFVDELAERMKAQREAILEALPPEQRAMARKQLPDVDAESARRSFKVNRTGNRDRVAGYDCHEAEIVDGSGQVKEIVCIASAAELGIATGDFQSLAGFMVNLAEIAAMSPDDDFLVDLEVLGGIPIRSEDVDFGEQSELVSISTTGVDPARLEIPGDYTEVSADALLQQ